MTGFERIASSSWVSTHYPYSRFYSYILNVNLSYDQPNVFWLVVHNYSTNQTTQKQRNVILCWKFSKVRIRTRAPCLYQWNVSSRILRIYVCKHAVEHILLTTCKIQNCTCTFLLIRPILDKILLGSVQLINICSTHKSMICMIMLRNINFHFHTS